MSGPDVAASEIGSPTTARQVDASTPVTATTANASTGQAWAGRSQRSTTCRCSGARVSSRWMRVCAAPLLGVSSPRACGLSITTNTGRWAVGTAAARSARRRRHSSGSSTAFMPG